MTITAESEETNAAGVPSTSGNNSFGNNSFLDPEADTELEAGLGGFIILKGKEVRGGEAGVGWGSVSRSWRSDGRLVHA